MKISRLLLITLLLAILGIGVHVLIYGSIFTNVTVMSASNTLFLIGVVTFFPTLALRLGSANLFLSFRYSVYRFVNAGKVKEYNSLSEYNKANKLTPKGGIVDEVLLISIIILISAYAIALNWSP